MPPELVMYSRTTGCPFVTLAKRVLTDYAVDYREIYIDRDPAARQRVLDWTGYLSVPTLVIAEPGGDLPVAAPAPLPEDSSPRGIDRGTMITEPGMEALKQWLHKHAFITELVED
ncbi:MAG: glutaredoxin family protein [Chloroflexi bacterium]|nr:glutaredoxin family protein [Chloroflexota bacterium]